MAHFNSIMISITYFDIGDGRLNSISGLTISVYYLNRLWCWIIQNSTDVSKIIIFTWMLF